ncbi:autophagy-related protein 13b-like isoform X1 [Coffea arabica]|uniref:Autophagy-related protein 13b-like isoform X1 n=1 Tax=Coffea arabica TaxID=13443 RepID=A0A6P6TBD7_COFAR|nr:autophagy-related protein 13b-like isoform X1 [Coffea arabica]XP_027075456.1 autophagy-related protein 13b-like isoform X1 [Coffea arabica]
MASNHGNTNSEPATNEQIITEFFAKSLHIILESRCPYVSSRNYSGEQVLSSPSSSSSSSSIFWPRDKWFNLALKDCSAALENIDFWRQSYLEPMVVDVVLVQRSSNWDPLNCSPKKALVRNLSSKERYYWNSENDEYRNEVMSEKIIERWVVEYESKKCSNIGGGGGGSGSKRWSSTSSHTLYKKSTLLLRSLYVTVRLLPAYKLFRDLISSAQIGMYNLGHRVSSFVEPFTHTEEAEMQRFVFTPVDTACGRLCLSVLYRSSISDVSSEPSTPMSPQFIPDYVGSPMADPLKTFPSGPLPQGSPSFSHLGRRHSWSYDLYKASPPSGIPSPSPSYSESHATFAKPHSYRLPPTGVTCHLPDETPQEHVKNTNYDEYSPSPNFSMSPSPSPPTYTPGIHISNALKRSESAPVSIPAIRASGIPPLFYNQMLPPSPPLRPSKSSLAKMDCRSTLLQAGSTVDKIFPFGKDEAGRLTGVKISSNSSPQKSISRSSSRLSFPDDYDESEFSGPFVVDEDDMTDPGSRPGSFDPVGNPCGQNDHLGVSAVKKSQDAAVGALVCMLKKAPPLQQDLQNSANLLHGSRPEILKSTTMDPNQISGQPVMQQSAAMSSAASLLAPKTTADALEELRGYAVMKNSLLKQGGDHKHT